MKYILKINAIGDFPEIIIDNQQFELLKSSRIILNEALAIEEKYEIVITNYLDLEKEYLNAAVSELVRGTIDYRDFFNLILSLNVRLVNLLTSVRLYIDTLASHISVCLPEVIDAKEQTEKLLKKEYDNNFEYRFMEAFRNHVQHRGTPVHRAFVGSHWTDVDKNNGLSEYFLYYSAKKEKLLSNISFKKSVLEEMPDEVNLCFTTRKYIESISTIHDQARKMIDCCVSKARQTFEDAIRIYKLEYEGNTIGLHAYAYNNDRKAHEIPILLEWDDVRIRLVNQNRQLVNLSKRYATGQAHNEI